MNLKGKVSSIENNKARVTFINKDNTVSPLLAIGTHVGKLGVGDTVAVMFFSDNMLDGIIIAKI